MSPTQRRPNVVLFLTDQQRWDTTGVHGNPMGITPNFDAMATAGTHAAHAFTPNPVCAPARAALQTGRWPTAAGVFRNGLPLPETERTLAHHFADAGYETAMIGKWHLAGEEPVPPAQRGGYQSWLGANLLEFTSDAYHTVVYDEANREVHLPGYRADALTDAAIRYLAGHTRSPFFLCLSLIEPHHQNQFDNYPAPEGYEERCRPAWVPPDLAALKGNAAQHLSGYYGQVKRVDECLGRLTDALRSLDLLEDTVVAYTADHGCHFRSRNDEYKRSCHDSSIRVPLAFRGPCFDGGGRVNELVTLADVAPTLLDAAGLGVPPRMQGRSMLEVLRSRGRRERPAWREDVIVQISESQVGRALRTTRWKYSVAARDVDPDLQPAADTYVEEFLYDLANDPYELRNLVHSAAHEDVARQCRQRLTAGLAELGEEAPSIIPAERSRRGQRSPEVTRVRESWQWRP